MLERDALTSVLDLLHEDDFYRDKHGIIYKTIKSLFAASEPVDIKTVVHKLRSDGTLEGLGGAYFVSDLTTKVNSAANIEYHARIVKEQSLKRHLITIGAEMARRSYEDTEDVFKLMDEYSEAIYRLNSTINSRNFVNLGDPDVVMELIETIEQNKKSHDNNEVVGISTGFPEIDAITGGLRPRELVIIAARPAMGKTAYIATMMKNIAILQNIPVGLFSMEMGWREIGMRFISMHSEVSIEDLRTGDFEQYQMEQVIHKSAPMLDKKIYVDDTPALTIVQLKTKARLMKQRYGIQVLLVDYIQLAQGNLPDNVKGNREQEIASISRGLKAISKDLDVAVIALSQLSRAVETRGGSKKPQLSDLRESGAIEQDADLVQFLYRPEYYGIMQDEAGMNTDGIGYVITAKNRNGRLSEEKLKFVGKYTRWDAIERTNFEEPFAVQSAPFPTSSNKEFTIVLP